MIRRRNGSWAVPETLYGLDQLKSDYLSATAAVEDGLKTAVEATEDIHVEYHLLRR